jgi:hypothetical protein
MFDFLAHRMIAVLDPRHDDDLIIALCKVGSHFGTFLSHRNVTRFDVF